MGEIVLHSQAKAIRVLWVFGMFSTAEIARLLNLPEAAVANELARQSDERLNGKGRVS